MIELKYLIITHLPILLYTHDSLISPLFEYMAITYNIYIPFHLHFVLVPSATVRLMFTTSPYADVSLVEVLSKVHSSGRTHGNNIP